MKMHIFLYAGEPLLSGCMVCGGRATRTIMWKIDPGSRGICQILGGLCSECTIEFEGEVRPIEENLRRALEI